MNDISEHIKGLVVQEGDDLWRVKFDTSGMRGYVIFMLRYYINGRPSEISGGSLHIAYDDGNVGHPSIAFCHQYALRNKDWLGSLIALVLLQEYDEDELWEMYEADFGVSDQDGVNLPYRPMCNLLGVLLEIIAYHRLVSDNDILQELFGPEPWVTINSLVDNGEWLGLLIADCLSCAPDWVNDGLKSILNVQGLT